MPTTQALTKPQRDWLQVIGYRSQTIRRVGEPVKSLARLGYAECDGNVWTLTPLGREILSEVRR